MSGSMTKEELAQLLVDASYRRDALKNSGCATYILGPKSASILCLCCGHGSYNSEDAARRYCNFCKDWHTDWIDRPSIPTL